MDAQAQLETLRQLDPEALTLAEARQGFRLLLALSEQLLAEQTVLPVAVADLQAQLARKSGEGGNRRGGGKGGGNAETSGGGSRSSEAERRAAEGRKPWQKSAKNDPLAIDAEHHLLLDLTLRSGDGVFERFETVVVQDLVLTRRNTRFVRAR